MKNEVKAERKYVLDAMKFFAAVIIIFHHYQQCTGLRFQRWNFYEGKFYFGYLVELFFMISGFVTYIQVNRDKDLSFRGFITRKIVRLYPMPILSIAMITSIRWIYRGLNGTWYNGSQIGIWKLVENVLLIFAGGGWHPK